jgi:uncharacterized Zn finger protein (UPF0148 family)
MNWLCPKCRSSFPKPGTGLCPWCGVGLEPPFQPGDVLRHIPTGRPVRVVHVDLEQYAVTTIDDLWTDPKDGKQKGGCMWLSGWPAVGFCK